MFELVKKIFNRNYVPKVKKQKIYDISIGGQTIISFTLDKNDLNIQIDPKLNVNVEMGETNITTHGDFILDTWKNKFHLNSRKSVHIKDLPEAIAFRAEAKELIKRHEVWADHHKEIVARIDKVVKEYEDEQLPTERNQPVSSGNTANSSLMTSRE